MSLLICILIMRAEGVVRAVGGKRVVRGVRVCGCVGGRVRRGGQRAPCPRGVIARVEGRAKSVETPPHVLLLLVVLAEMRVSRFQDVHLVVHLRVTVDHLLHLLDGQARHWGVRVYGSVYRCVRRHRKVRSTLPLTALILVFISRHFPHSFIFLAFLVFFIFLVFFNLFVFFVFFMLVEPFRFVECGHLSGERSDGCQAGGQTGTL